MTSNLGLPTKIKHTFKDLLQAGNNGDGPPANASPLPVAYGDGTTTPLSISHTRLEVTNQPIQALAIPSKGYVDTKPILSDPAARQMNMLSGTTFALPVGNVQTTEITTITKGMTSPNLPNWNSSGLNMVAFGDLCCLPSGKLITVYTRCQSESQFNGTSKIVMRSSMDGGQSWTGETVLISASSFGSTYSANTGSVWYGSMGRVFLNFWGGSNGNQQNTYIIASDDDGETWDALGANPVSVVDSGSSWTIGFRVQNKGAEIPDGRGPNGSGTLIMTGDGLNLASAYSSNILVGSTDGGLTWTRISRINNGDTDSMRYVEPIPLVIGPTSILVLIRINNITTIGSALSTDGGQTWGSVNLLFSGAGKPAGLVCHDGTIVCCSRSTDAGNPNMMRTSRDNGVSWGRENVFDARTQYLTAGGSELFYSYYSGLAEYSPGVVACAYGVASPIAGTGTTRTDWCFTYFLNGRTRSPLGTVYARDFACYRPAFNRQVLQDPALPIAYATTDTTVLRDTLNGVLQLLETCGLGVISPKDVPGVLGWYEPWLLSNLNIGDAVGTLPDLSGAGLSGDLVQATTANKPIFQQTSWLFGGRPYLAWQGGAKQLLGSTFSVKSQPYTYMLVYMCPQTTTGNSTIMYGQSSGNYSGLSLSSGNQITGTGGTGGGGGSLLAPAFTVFGQGPMILTLEVNGASSKLWINGSLVASGSLGNSQLAQLALGNTASSSYMYVAHFSAYAPGAALGSYRQKLERMLAVGFQVEAYNPY